MASGTDNIAERPLVQPGDRRGTNQTEMRAQNERLVLSLVRQHRALAKSDIARATGLSAQSVSVIMRDLEQHGLLLRGEPVRGRIGQPSVPMSIAPGGAYFLGLKIGRRSADLVVVNFLGAVQASRRSLYRYPTPESILAFVAGTLPDLLATLPEEARSRLGGMGVAMPFQLWNWVDFIGAPAEEMEAWRHSDVRADLQVLTGLPVFVQNDATAACGAELVFGTAEKPQDFMCIFFGYIIGGGLVLGNRLFTGRTGNAAGLGPLPVPGPDGQMCRLMDVASLSTLALAMEAAGHSSESLWADPEDWQVPPAVLDRWIDKSAGALASAILSAATLLEFDAVLIDGWLPRAVRAALTGRTRAAYFRLDLAGVEPLVIVEGSVGSNARALGAAAIPLAHRAMVDRGAAPREAGPRGD